MAKILVIENEPNIQKMIEVNLAASGYEVLVALDGELGLAVVQQEYPDLILLDLRLPGISGWDVLASLKDRQKLREIPVIMMTASAQDDQEEKARLAGAAGYLLKPFTADELMLNVKQSLEKRR